jgi:hypothetical protein
MKRSFALLAVVAAFPLQAAAEPPLSPGEALKAIHLLGARKLDELERRGDGEMPAVGPCTRPSAVERTAIRDRVLAWVKRETPGETDFVGGLLLNVRFGCVEAGGIVVDAYAERFAKGYRGEMPNSGHWWTLRITPRAITTLAALHGLAVASFNGASRQSYTATLGLADLDRDGTLDPVIVASTREGASPHRDVELSIALSKVAMTRPIASFRGEVEFMGGVVGGAVVVRIADDAGYRYPCIDTPLALASCREAVAVRHRDDQIAAAAELVRATELPDRRDLAAKLVLLDVPVATQAPLVRAAGIK